MYKGQIPILVTGRRKATASYCLECHTWHPTPRGIGESGCPKDEPRDPDAAHPAAIIDRTHLGDVRRARVQVPVRPDGTVGAPIVKGVR